MKFSENTLRRVPETAYLNLEKTPYYRAIIRVMYKEYEKMRYSLYWQDIHEAILQYEQFSEYSPEALKSDLDVLIAYGNIFARADAARVSTPEEFLNKVLLYQLSPVSVELERMMIHLESVDSGAVQKSSLESSYIEEFKTILFEIESQKDKDEKTNHDWWENLNDAFRKFSENYKDYISDFYAPKNNELMKTSEFLIFKEKFLIYLRNFITGVQMNANEIENFMIVLDGESIAGIIKKSADYEQNIPRMNSVFNYDEYIALNMGKFETMREWFLRSNNRPPLYQQLIEHTSEIIRMITRFALQILDRHNLGLNRKKDYFKMIEIFMNSENISEAHKIFALIFGLSGTRHIMADEYRETDSINSSVYDENPRMVSVKPNTNTYREKITKSTIPDFSKDKEKRNKEMMEKRSLDEAEIRRLIIDGKIDLKSVPVLNCNQRLQILNYFSRKIKDENDAFVGETEFGARFRLYKKSDEIIKIRCEDGDFYMPHFIIEIEDEQKNGTN